MFWKYNAPSSAQIDNLLQKEDVTLAELMEEEELLQECKGQNKKVVAFLTKPNILEELVNMVVEDPSAEKEIQIRFKFANLATELLTCDVPAIIDNLTSSNLLLILYRYLTNEKPLNPLMASFVSKVLGMLVTRRTDQNWYAYQLTCFQVMEFLKSKGDFVELAVQHIGTSAIMDLLSKLICGVDSDDQEIRAGIHRWLDECQLIEKLIEKLSPDCDPDEHSSVDQLLCELTYTGRDPSINGTERQQNGCKSNLLSTLEGELVVNKLLDILLLEHRTESSVSHVINILLILLSNKNPDRQTYFQHIPSIEFVSDVTDNKSVIRTMQNRLPEIQRILLQPFKLQSLLTSFDMEVERLGSMRLQIINLIASLIASNDALVHSKLAELSTLKVLLDLFLKFSLNNFLHTQVTYCIRCILENSLTFSDKEVTAKRDAQIDGLNNNPLKNDQSESGPQMESVQAQCPPEDASGGEVQAVEGLHLEDQDHVEEIPGEETPLPLLDQLFNECCIIQMILTEHREQKQNSSPPEKKLHNLRGYMGHIREIANCIVDCTTDGLNSEYIKRLIQRLPQEVITDWEEFSQGTLCEINLKNKVTIVQEFKDGGMDMISELPAGYKKGMPQIRRMTLNAESNAQSPNIDWDSDNSMMESLDLFEMMCSQKLGPSEEFEEMWKYNEKEIQFAPKLSEDENAHSSSEEEADIDDEFDTLRNKQEKMDIDDIPGDDFAELDQRSCSGSAASVEATSFNPWNLAPASDTKDTSNWAKFPPDVKKYIDDLFERTNFLPNYESDSDSEDDMSSEMCETVKNPPHVQPIDDKPIMAPEFDCHVEDLESEKSQDFDVPLEEPREHDSGVAPSNPQPEMIPEASFETKDTIP